MVEAIRTLSWVEEEFSEIEAAHMRRELPAAIARAQRQSANAHDAFDPEGTERYVYGVGMSRADHDQIRDALSSLESFTTKRPTGAKRDVLFVGGKVILPIRVGTTMPKKIDRIRLKRVSPYRSGLLAATSMNKYDTVLDLFADEETDELEQEVEEAELDFLQTAAAKNSLVVVYYSSTPGGIGSIYWAPAMFGEKNQLRFTAPERLSVEENFTALAAVDAAAQSDPDAFGVGERPVTVTKLRTNPKLPAEA